MAGRLTVAESITKDLKSKADSTRAAFLMRFFKTSSGQYGAGDVFYGVRVPQSRQIAIKYSSEASVHGDIRSLMMSRFHEERLVGLLLLIDKFAKSRSEDERREFIKFYIDVKDRVNNWDLVDTSAPRLLGAYLHDKRNRSILYTLAKSNNLWDRRIAILSTLYFITKNDFADALGISEILIKSDERHDLIEKAVGWILREVGKRNRKLEEKFIQENYGIIPRTTLRYAIERFPRRKRLHYLSLGMVIKRSQ